MTCSGCTTNVESALSNLKEVKSVSANLKGGEVMLEMSSHIPIEKLQETLLKSGLHYTLEIPGKENEDGKNQHKHVMIKDGNGVFYCPMHCEGEKTYNKEGDCPVCGMDLIEQPKLIRSTRYTCSMHPEIIKDTPGSCPICGMDLIPMEPTDSEEDKTYQKLWTKMKVALIFTIPIFLIAMTEMLPNNFLLNIFSQNSWNWIQFALSLPVVFYACWMFFERAWNQ